MAAPTSPQLGADFLLKLDDTTIAGRRGGTLSINKDEIDVSNVSDVDWPNTLPNIETAEISFDGLAFEGATPAPEHGHGGSISLSTDDGTSFTAIERAREMVLDWSMDPLDGAAHDTAKARVIVPGRRTWSMTSSGLYVDPAGTGGAGHEVAMDAYENETGVLVKLAFGSEGSFFQGPGRVLGYEHQPGHDQIVGITYNISPRGALAATLTNMGSGLAALVNGLVAADLPSFTALFTTEVTGATQWTGTGYPTQLTFTVPHNDAITVSGTIAISGIMTRGVTA